MCVCVCTEHQDIAVSWLNDPFLRRCLDRGSNKLFLRFQSSTSQCSVFDWELCTVRSSRSSSAFFFLMPVTSGFLQYVEEGGH